MTRTRDYQEFDIEWRGIRVRVRWCPDWMELEGLLSTGHLELRSRDKRPLPVTETGYRSHFLHREEVEARGGAVAYATAWLDEAATSAAWQQRELASNQESLF